MIRFSDCAQEVIEDFVEVGLLQPDFSRCSAAAEEARAKCGLWRRSRAALCCLLIGKGLLDYCRSSHGHKDELRYLRS